jgi:hypothetical protein
VLGEIHVTDAVVPEYVEKDAFEIKDHVFLVEANGVKYAYTLLAKPNTQTKAAEVITNVNNIQGIHIWKYSGNQKVFNFQMPDTTSIKFHTVEQGSSVKELTYKLVNSKKLYYADLTTIASIIGGQTSEYNTDVSRYDYNLSGHIDREDLVIALNIWSSNIYSPFWGLNESAFFRFIKNLEKLNCQNIIMLRTKSDVPVEYAYNVPVGDLVDDFDGYCVSSVMQVLPAEYLDVVKNSPYAELIFEDEPEDEWRDDCKYVGWIPTTKHWLTIDYPSDNWWFRAGYYAFVLDESGHYVKDWFGATS